MNNNQHSRPAFFSRLRQSWRSIHLVLSFLLALIGSTIVLGISISNQQDDLLLKINDVAQQDILAPYATSFTSVILTEQSREQAASSVAAIYDPPDSQTARQQLENLEAALSFLEAIRLDLNSSMEVKLQDISLLQDVQFTSESTLELIELSEPRWQVVKLESVSVLEQVMRTEIRDEEISEALRSIPALVSISMPDHEARIVRSLVSGYVASNAQYNETATQNVRQQAREAVDPVIKTFAEGETIIGRGQLVNALHIEAMEIYGLLKQPEAWKEITYRFLLVLTLLLLFVLYFQRTKPERLHTAKISFTASFLLVLGTLGLQIMIPGHAILPYLFPAATIPMLLAILINPGAGILGAIFIGALGGYMSPRGLEIMLYISLSGIIGALVIQKAERLSSFFWAGLASSMTSIAIVVVFRFSDPGTDLIGNISLISSGVISGLLSASLSFGLLLLLGKLLGIMTSLQLIELARPDHPLLQMLLRNAPGSYQHSLQVANLAEQAARTIGANPELTRVGALHHDVGKALNPQCFIENQVPGQNIHDQLDPISSARIILDHVTDGLSLAQKYRLPERVQAFISEHHGSSITSYQYRKALKAADGDRSLVNKKDFTYPGPRPQSRETAILMLADSVEAKARALKPENEDAIDELVRSIIQDRLNMHQLDDTALTLQDLNYIRQSFVSTLKGMYHPRIPYPEIPKDKADEISESTQGNPTVKSS